MSAPNPKIDLIAANCVAVKLRLLNRAISSIYDDVLRPLGLKVSQLNILVATAKMRLARPGQMCEALCLDESTLSRNVDRMRAKGWLENVPDQEDARQQPFRLTKSGTRLLEKAIPAWEFAQHQAEALLGEPGLQALKLAVQAVRGRRGPAK
jgi:DNA-binding MarR family transcriptional regulator